MAVYRKKQPARRPVRRGWKRHARTGMFLFAFALVAVTVGVILPHAGVMSAAAEGSTLTEKIFTTVQNKNLPVIAIDPGHGGTDPGRKACDQHGSRGKCQQVPQKFPHAALPERKAQHIAPQPQKAAQPQTPQDVLNGGNRRRCGGHISGTAAPAARRRTGGFRRIAKIRSCR